MRCISSVVLLQLAFLLSSHAAFSQIMQMHANDVGSVEMMTYVTGSPFTAHQTSLMVRNGKPISETMVLARSSNGSIFRSFYAMGQVSYRSSIDDVPNHRLINLDLRAHTYWVREQPSMLTETEEQYFAVLKKKEQEDQLRPVVRLGQSGSETRTDLGTKVQNGFTLHGRLVESVQPLRPTPAKPSPGSTVMRKEEWNAEFGVNMMSSFTLYNDASPNDPHQTLKNEGIITDLIRQEPDAALFRIPDGFTQVDAPMNTMAAATKP